MASSRSNGSPRRPVERAIEQAEAAGAEPARCPHADIAARIGQQNCRICNQLAQLGRLGYGACSWAADGAQDPGRGKLDRVRPQDPDQQVLPAGAMAKPGRQQGSALDQGRTAAHTGAV